MPFNEKYDLISISYCAQNTCVLERVVFIHLWQLLPANSAIARRVPGKNLSGFIKSCVFLKATL